VAKINHLSLSVSDKVTTPESAPKPADAAPDPRPDPKSSRGYITRDRLAEIVRMTPRRISQLVDAGVIPKAARGRYDTEAALSAFIAYLYDREKNRKSDMKVEQQLLTKARRETAEHELAVARGEYIPRSEIGPALRNVGLHQRAMILRRYEQELAPKLAGRNTIEILAMVREANDDVLAVFREGVRRWMDEEKKAEAKL